MSKNINIGMGEIAVVNRPAIIQSLGIGSCIVIALYDREKKIGSLSHIVAVGTEQINPGLNPLRFATKAIPKMLSGMKHLGSSGKITAKIAGGASMFKSESFKVGEKNIKGVQKILQELHIPILDGDVGGNMGRNVWFDTSDGSVVVGRTRGTTIEI
jgi:chemotaxis protein CheD